MLPLIVGTHIAYTMEPRQAKPQGQKARPAIPAVQVQQILEQVRVRQHQCWRQMFGLTRSLHGTYTELRSFTKPIAKTLAWAGTVFGVYKSYRWYHRGQPTVGRYFLACLGGISSFVGSHLARLCVHPTIPVLDAFLQHRTEIRNVYTRELEIVVQLMPLLKQYQVYKDRVNPVFGETKNAAFAEEDPEYQRTSPWRHINFD